MPQLTTAARLFGRRCPVQQAIESICRSALPRFLSAQCLPRRPWPERGPMAKEICISTTPHETRLAIIEDDQLAEIYYERENEYTLAGSIYNGRVTRVLPGMQSAFVEVGLERDAFLYVTDFLEDSEDSDEYETSGGGAIGLRSPAPSDEQPAQSEQESRPRRGRRDNRRGGRAERSERSERPEGSESEPAPLTLTAPPEPNLSSEGDGSEESPQGTRRWRGRRGRRRGGVRSGVLGSSAEIEIDQEGVRAEPASDLSTVEFATPERGAPGGVAPPADSLEETEERQNSFDIHAGAEAPPPRSRDRRESRQSRESSVAQAQPTGSSRSPILLPGESLARHGGKPTEALQEPAAPAKAAPPANYTPFRPASQVEVPEGWDGGFALPGETLSRHQASPPVITQPAAGTTGETDAPAELPTHEAITEETLSHDAQTHDALTHDDRSEEIFIISSPEIAAEALPEAGEHPERLTTSAEPIDPAEQTAHATEEATPTEDYNPEGDSVSVRVTPPRSDLRLSQLFGGSSAPKKTDEAPENSRPGRGEEQQSQEQAHEDLRRTTLHAGEEGQSEIDRNISGETENRSGRPATESVTNEASFSTLVDQLHGSHMVEEEIIDEEEYDFDPIHRHSEDHDLEDIEEETLDGSAEVGIAHTAEPVEFSEKGKEDAAFLLEEVDEDQKEAVLSDNGDSERPESTEAAPGRRSGRSSSRRRSAGGNGGGSRRQSAQMQDLPIISDLLKPGQEILVQIAKEPIAQKGARITSHIALPGRFLVFMPTVSNIGVSRKIDSDEERRRLKSILISERGETTGGFIVRTAADGATEEELRADLRFLINLWSEIKQRSEAAKSPALIYHDLNLVERILRDQVSSNFSTIWVDTEQEYERIVRFLNRFQPSLVRRVKLYTKETPLFEHFGIQEEISKALKSKVWLKSGGSIVINQTEALVAIDINTGKYVGKTARLEDTIVKTNLDAIPEIVRQIRLRDLGGIIVIDFIDMDERKNRHRVLAALEEAMKVDRAPSKVLQFNDFGLVAITRKRVKQSLERTLSVQCEACAGTGMVKSPTTVCNEIYVELRKMRKHLDGKDVMLRVNPEVVKQLKSSSGRWINEYEEMIGKTIIIKSDASLHPEHFDIH